MPNLHKRPPYEFGIAGCYPSEKRPIRHPFSYMDIVLNRYRNDDLYKDRLKTRAAFWLEFATHNAVIAAQYR